MCYRNYICHIGVNDMMWILLISVTIVTGLLRGVIDYKYNQE